MFRIASNSFIVLCHSYLLIEYNCTPAEYYNVYGEYYYVVLVLSSIKIVLFQLT